MPANGKSGPALGQYEKELEVGLALAGPEGKSVAVCYGSMGLVHKDMGEYDRALELFEQDAAITEAKNPGSVGLANTFNIVFFILICGNNI